ncbi:PepSY domain-containing protein [Cereibacter sphaeroides]|uniref:PepSY-associated TM helix domain-containing protein n=1 Tax=Cereibacter sphaeroides TaxID=1063 RepID=UPI00313AEC9B
MTTQTLDPQRDASRSSTNKLYFAAWRWHFYAGLFVVPFLLILAVTGMIMMISTAASNQLGNVADVAITGAPVPVTAQAEAALAAVPSGILNQYVAPEAPDRPAFFAIEQGHAVMSVAVDPYTGAVLNSQDKTTTLYAVANRIHGTLLIGETGDRVMETAASLIVLLIVTGLWMWLPKAGLRAVVPDLRARGRSLFKSLHTSVGTAISLFLLLFVLSGLSWTGIWGGQFVQPWSSFPAEKTWTGVPLSDRTHASMNHAGHQDVAWGMEQVPMPASGSEAGTAGVSGDVTLDTVSAWAGRNGFSGQYRISVPQDESGVFTVMAEVRNEDGVMPWADRTTHLDRLTGNVLADVRYADYAPMAKAMAWGIGLHKGLVGPLNFAFNLLFLLLVIATCVTGVAMWWKRRPSGAGRLAAPPMPRDMPLWKGAVLVALALAMAFPMAGVALLAVVALDVLLLSKVPALKRLLN